MRRVMAVLLLMGLAACTKYQPLAWDGLGSWSRARALANAARPEGAARPERRAVATDRGALKFRLLPPAGTATAEAVRRHRVLPGDTLSGLATRYDLPMAALARANGIKPPFRVHAGQVLTIPQARTAKPAASTVLAAPSPAPAAATIAAREVGPPPVRPEARGSALLAAAGRTTAVAAPSVPAEQVEAARRAAQQKPPSLSGAGFLWPVRGPLASAFGEKPNGARNNGINIGAAEGAPVLAAENGIVVYAGDELASYGNMLLLRHAGDFTTAYAHARELLVRVGDVVKRGQPIATVGATGAVATPQLHFELRAGKKPLDPLAYLDRHRTQLASTR